MDYICMYLVSVEGDPVDLGEQGIEESYTDLDEAMEALLTLKTRREQELDDIDCSMNPYEARFLFVLYFVVLADLGNGKYDTVYESSHPMYDAYYAEDINPAIVEEARSWAQELADAFHAGELPIDE